MKNFWIAILILLIPQCVNAAPDPLVKDINILAQIQETADTTPAKLTEIGQNYSYVLTLFADAPQITALKAENSSLQVGLFTNPFFHHSDVPAWYLLQEDGTPILHEGANVYDTRIAAYRTQFVTDWATLLTSSGADSIFLDTMEEKLWVSGSNGKLPAGYKVNTWAREQHRFFEAVKAGIPAGKKLCTNSSTRAPGIMDTGNHGFKFRSDCQSIEAYSKFLAIDANWWNKYWYVTQTINDLADHDGKDIFIEVTGDATNIETRLLALGGFLLVQDDKTHFYFRDTASNGTDLVWWDEWDAPIGTPSGPYGVDVPHGNLYRDFSNGKVLVNPHNADLVVPAPGLKNWDGTAINDPITLPPSSARILINQ